MTDPNIPDTPELAPYRIAALDFIKRAIQVEIDDSSDALAFVDHYLQKARTAKPEIKALIAPALGVYFGDLCIREFGGKWLLERGEAEPARWRVELEPVPLHFFPVGFVAASLAQDDLDEYDTTLATNLKWSLKLAQGLADVPPVEQEYFYSLTGRFETIGFAVQLLAEFERQEKEAQSAPKPPSDDDLPN